MLARVDRLAVRPRVERLGRVLTRGKASADLGSLGLRACFDFWGGGRARSCRSREAAWAMLGSSVRVRLRREGGADYDGTGVSE